MDLFTTIAQIVNFLILVALLKHFLYGRVVTAMDEREAMIAARLEQARTREAEAEAAAAGYQAQSAALERSRAQALARAGRESEEQRRQLLDQARQDVIAAKARWFAELEREKEAFLSELSQRAGRELYQIAEQVLSDLAGAELEQAIVVTFIKRLQELPFSQRQRLSRWAAESQRPLAIFSSFEPPAVLRQRLIRELDRLAGRELRLDFQLSPEPLAGIEIRFDGHKIGWSLGSYLRSLEQGLSEALFTGEPLAVAQSEEVADDGRSRG